MVFKDLLNLEGQVIHYYIVRGNIVETKRAKVHMSNYYGGNEIQLQFVDKLGRCNQYCYHSIDLRGSYKNENPKNASVYNFGWRNMLFLNKEEAYNHVINNLRKQRREINRKMLKAHLELYGKKMEEKNEG